MTHFHQYWRALFAARALTGAWSGFADRIWIPDRLRPGWPISRSVWSGLAGFGPSRACGGSSWAATRSSEASIAGLSRLSAEFSSRSACDLAVRGPAGNSATAMQP